MDPEGVRATATAAGEPPHDALSPEGRAAMTHYTRLQIDVEDAIVNAARRRAAIIEAAVAKRLAEADRQSAERTRQSLATAADLMYGIRTEAERVAAELVDTARVEAERISRQCVSDAQRISDELIADAERRALRIIAQVQGPPAPATEAQPLPLPPPPDPTSGAGTAPGAVIDAEGASPDDGPARVRRRRLPRVPMTIRIVLLVVVAVIAADLMRSFVVESYTVASTSMEPRLHDGDRLVVDKLSYRVRDMRRGDVVIIDTGDIPVLTRPEGDSVVKRVIALPGERIEAIEGNVLVDGQVLDEPWLSDDVLTPDFGPLLVPDDSIFVLGDNRAVSIDGRTFGSVTMGSVIGRVEWVIWPIGDAGRL